MCGDFSGQPALMAIGSPESRSLEEKLMRLTEHNARLVQQQRDQEHCLREMQNELAQLREEDNARRVARFAQEKASCVLRHEEQIQKLRHHYEQQLAALEPPGQVRQIEIDRLRRAVVDEQSRANQAETAREAADALVNRQKRKLLKLQQLQNEQVQNIRKRLKRWASGATKRIALDHGRLVFSMWHVVAKRRSSDKEAFNLEAERWATTALTQQSLRFRPTVLAITAARPMLSALAALRAWACVVSFSNDEILFQRQLERLQHQSSAELASIRYELNCATAVHRREKQDLLVLALSIAGWINIARAREDKRKALVGSRCVGALAVVHAREQMFMFRAMQAWAFAASEVRHASRIAGSLDEASRLSTCALAMARSEVRSLRVQRHKIAIDVLEWRAVARLAAPFGAWAREALQVQLRKRGRGDVVLNSGEAAKRAMKALEEAREQHEKQLIACKNEVSEYCVVATVASRAKHRAHTISERLHRLLDKELKEITLQTVLRRWHDAILEDRCSDADKSKHSEKRSFAALDILTRSIDSERVIIAVLASWHKETLGMLHERALGKALADASKKSEVMLACVHRENRKALQAAWGSSSDASRRNAAFERRQAAENDASLQRSIRELLREEPRPASRPSTARELEAHFESIEKRARDLTMTASGSTTPSTAASSTLAATEGSSHSPNCLDREARCCLISDLLDLRRGEAQNATLTSLALILQSWRCQTAESLRERWVHAAREGRKGLFVAALAQQARYWMADGFVAWRQSFMEARCQQLQAAAAAASGHLVDATPSTKAPPSGRKSKSVSSPGQELMSGSSRPRRISN